MANMIRAEIDVKTMIRMLIQGIHADDEDDEDGPTDDLANAKADPELQHRIRNRVAENTVRKELLDKVRASVRTAPVCGSTREQ
jgi:hypothetical protein